MTDYLVRLYDLPHVESEVKVAEAGIVVRRAIGPELHVILDWIGKHFSRGWVSEATVALTQLPSTCWIAVKDGQILGFACHDATTKGFFGPTGVLDSARGQGIGEALLMATLKGMREAGYGYAVIGDPGPVAFYQKRLDATAIPKSKPGVYAGMLRDRPSGDDN